MKKLKDGWMLETVGELFDIQLGKMLNQKAIELSPKYPYLGNSNVRWGTFDLENLKTMHFSEKEINKFSLQKNDILMCEGGEVGRCAIWENESREIYYQKALHRLRSKGKILPRYFYHYMAFIAGTKLLDNQTTKTSIAHLTREKLSALKIPVPPLEEQIQIAETLSTWDKAIQTTERLILNSEKQKQALMQVLLNGKKRCGFTGEWKKVKLGTLIQEIKKAKVQNPKQLELLTVKLHYKGTIPTRKKPNATEKGRTYYKRLKGELIVGRQNLHNGGIAIVDEKCDGLIASNAISSFSALEFADIVFVLNIMSTPYFRNYVDSLTGGTGQKEISVKEILNIPVLVPELLEQQKIAEILSTADQEIETLQRKLEFLKLEKGALMQRLLG